MKKLRTYYILILWLMAFSCFGQNKLVSLSGKVTFVTSQNVYVKFASAKNIAIGDTLQLSKAQSLSPCLLVNNKSSTSCVCKIINGCEINKGDEVIFKFIKIETKIEAEEVVDKDEEQAPTVEELAKEPKERKGYKERIRASVSAASYSSIYPLRENKHRMMYRFSFNASHFNQSKYSLESYINYRENLNPSPNATIQTKFFRVYNLALRYDVDSTLSLTLGRKINNKTASLGALDGLQAEKYFGNLYTGVLVGFRPDIYAYDLNLHLFQYGAYVGLKASRQNLYAQTTLGILEQRNTGRIDRRYAYFQHSSNIKRKLYLFSSFELDLYNTLNRVSSHPFRLTNLYASARYRFNRKINISVSYNSRKRILYYETFKTDIERLLDDDQPRQGVRFRLSVRPFKLVNVGLSYNRRFQSNGENKSDNINGYISLSKVPAVGGRLAVNFNDNKSNYLESKILSFRYSRAIIKNKLNADFYFRMVQYTYFSSDLAFDQQYYGTNLSYRITKRWRFSILAEMASKKTGNNFRINTKLTKRFEKKKKRK